MSMNLNSVNAASGYSSDRSKSDSVQAQTITPSDVNQINSIKALAKEEMKGTRVSVGDEQTIRNIERALKAIQGKDTSFEMSVHEGTNTIVIKVLNKETGELIREVPPEKTLDLVAKFMEINGILIDERI